MIAVDTNILIYAHREEFEEHYLAKDKITELAIGEEVWVIPIFCISEFLRVVTHPSILSPPSSMKLAVSTIEVLLNSPSVRVLYPSDQFITVFMECCTESSIKGNLVFDAQIVSLLRENGIRKILTHDRDFMKFKHLEVCSLDHSS